MATKTKSIFDFLKCVFQEKTPWEELTESDRKAFSPYMMNRWISMHPDYIGIVNFLQQYTIEGMKPREVYKLYCDILPPVKFWSKYIKAKTTKADKVNKNLVEFVATQEQWSRAESRDNLAFIMARGPEGHQLLIDYLDAFGISQKDASLKYNLIPF